MVKRVVGNSLGLSKEEFTQQLVEKSKGLSSIEFALEVKNYSTEDFHTVCDVLGVSYKGYEGRILLLSRLYFYLTAYHQTSQSTETTKYLN